MPVLKCLLLFLGCSTATEDIFGSLSLSPVGLNDSLLTGNTKWTDMVDARDTPEVVDARDIADARDIVDAVDARDIADARDTTDVRDIADARDIAVSDSLVPAAAVSTLSGSWLHAALILSNYRREKRREADITVELAMIGILDSEGRGTVVRNETKLANYFQRLVRSVLRHSTGTPLHLLLVTEEESVAWIRADLKNLLGQQLSEAVIRRPSRDMLGQATRFPKIRTEFVSLASIVTPHRAEIDRMKRHFGHHLPVDYKFVNPAGVTVVPTFKYTLDLFYILPFYHRVFPAGLTKLLVLDADLEVKCDLRKVWRHFAFFSESQVVGVGRDLSPHYFSITSQYRKQNPQTNVGRPEGVSQGLNTGVALYNLAAMRRSLEYSEQCRAEVQEELAEEYMLKGTVGDQDWMTLLGWAKPHLVYLLPCQFNVQTDQVYNTPAWSDVWQSYHHCPNNTLIRHDNGE